MKEYIVEFDTNDMTPKQELIRCKDCKYSKYLDVYGEQAILCERGDLGVGISGINEDDYCSSAERKEQ